MKHVHEWKTHGLFQRSDKELRRSQWLERLLSTSGKIFELVDVLWSKEIIENAEDEYHFPLFISMVPLTDTILPRFILTISWWLYCRL